MNILIAEDSQMIQMLQRELMENWGYSYDLASNGMEAVEYTKKNNGKYDLCLMDVEMPKMNGIEATKIIRRTATYFPILALTADNAYKKACYEAGMDDFAEKPCLPDKLFNKINELVVRLYSFSTKQANLDITEVKPVDQKHAQELRELKKQHLIKIKFDDISGAEVVIHENIINKIVDDFNIKKQFVSTFLNRNPDKPTKCVLFSNNCRMPQVYLDDDDYASELHADNEEAKAHPEMIVRIEKDV
ncbi:MAG: response regulator [Candidatus Thiodiazotropha sp. (ex Dulcina madagascariensis)]|nr:response regulator [Candidatus Thiodiazotropha sp. (ex Dulcina madagascariensis)]